MHFFSFWDGRVGWSEKWECWIGWEMGGLDGVRDGRLDGVRDGRVGMNVRWEGCIEWEMGGLDWVRDGRVGLTVRQEGWIGWGMGEFWKDFYSHLSACDLYRGSWSLRTALSCRVVSRWDVGRVPAPAPGRCWWPLPSLPRCPGPWGFLWWSNHRPPGNERCWYQTRNTLKNMTRRHFILIPLRK